MVIVMFHVRGMTGDHCAASVTRAVGTLDGVAGVEVDLAARSVTVTSMAPLDWAAVSAAVAEAGYELV